MELFLECQGMAIECRTGSKPALYRCCEALLFVADWRFWCLAAALFLHLWLLLPYSPVFLSVVMPPVFFFFPSRDLLFFVTSYYSASPSTLPHPHPLLMSWLHHVSSYFLSGGWLLIPWIPHFFDFWGWWHMLWDSSVLCHSTFCLYLFIPL